MNDIFNYINPYGNDMFLSKGNEFLEKINRYYPDYRDSINIDKVSTFGTEIEFEDANLEAINELLLDFYNSKKWYLSIDNTLDDGAEISSPVLKNNKKNWNELKEVCNILKKYSIINDNCGGHVHVGAHILGNNYEYWNNFLSIWATYEHIIFKYTSDGRLIRPRVLRYAIPMSKTLWTLKNKINSDNLDSIINKISIDKNQAISFQNININKCDKYKKNNTIEFRCPNGTLDILTWQNNINLFIKLLEYSKSDLFDKELIEYNYKINRKILNKVDLNDYSSLYVYNREYLRQALELCDLIFDNNLDKLNFVKQYTKKITK